MGFFCFFFFFFFFGKLLRSEGDCRVANQQHRRRLLLLLLLLHHRDESKLWSGEASWNERVFFPCKLLATPESPTHSLNESPQTTFSCPEPTIYVLITPYENVPSPRALVG